jgi:hypothetical protein
MATITINGDSPGAPSPIQVSSWLADIQEIDAAATQTSSDGADPTVFSGNITQDQADTIAGAGWTATVV